MPEDLYAELEQAINKYRKSHDPKHQERIISIFQEFDREGKKIYEDPKLKLIEKKYQEIVTRIVQQRNSATLRLADEREKQQKIAEQRRREAEQKAKNKPKRRL